MARRLGTAVLLLAVAGCGGGARLDADGPARTYRLGEPDVALEAIGTTAGDTIGLDLVLVLEPASLTYRPAGDSLEAVVEWAGRVVGGAGPPAFVEGVDTLRVADAGAVRAAPPVVYSARVAHPPGVYRVEAAVTDLGADRTARRTAAATVRAADAGPWLSGLRLVESGAGRPLVATRLPAASDSVRAVAEGLGLPENAGLRASVVRLRADTTAAAPLTADAPPPTSLAARGVDASAPDTVWTARRALGAGGAVPVEVALPALAPGLYAVGLVVRDADGATVASSSRRVVVRRRDYPLATRLGDLVDPLVYLAEPGEMDALRQGRRAFDAFWGRRTADRRQAAAALRTFYERVERANRLFSNQKAGWRTDPGMVYVLFGPPDAVRETPVGETWTYRRRPAPAPGRLRADGRALRGGLAVRGPHGAARPPVRGRPASGAGVVAGGACAVG